MECLALMRMYMYPGKSNGTTMHKAQDLLALSTLSSSRIGHLIIGYSDQVIPDNGTRRAIIELMIAPAVVVPGTKLIVKACKI